MLTLGIPSNTVMALMVGALIMHDIQHGRDEQCFIGEAVHTVTLFSGGIRLLPPDNQPTGIFKTAFPPIGQKS